MAFSRPREVSVALTLVNLSEDFPDEGPVMMQKLKTKTTYGSGKQAAQVRVNKSQLCDPLEGHRTFSAISALRVGGTRRRRHAH